MRTIWLFVLLLPGTVAGQRNFTLSGKVTDGETGEDLIGVTVLVGENNTGVITNSYGFYSITLPQGAYTIQYRYVGYGIHEEQLALNSNQVLNVEIAPVPTSLEEVTVMAERPDRKITAPESGIEKIDMREVEILPFLFGERDVLKMVQLLPGISNATEGNTGFHVRGGSMGQNLILLDEAPVYSSSHMLGFFSVFNPDAIKSVTMYKGGIPAAYGGRAASVLDISMNNGNNKRFSFSGGVGLVASRLNLEVPLIRDRMSLVVSGRRTYGDLFAKALFPDRLVSDDMDFFFYDLNAKLNYSINQRNRIYLSGYFGKDVFELRDNLGTTWGNATGTLRWNHLFSEKLFSNTSLVYSRYDYGFLFGQGSIRLKAGIEDLTFKEDATLFLNPQNTMKFGISAIYHRFQPSELNLSGETDYVQASRGKRAYEAGAYLQNEQRIGERISTNYGLRFTSFAQLGPGWFYDYDSLNQPVDSVYYDNWEAAFPAFSLEPRISLNYQLNSRSSLKASYNRISQYLHLLSNTAASSFTVIWVPGSNNLKPLRVDHFSAGYFRNFRNNTIETSLEVYYKQMHNTADYEDGADIMFDEHLEAQIRMGIGRSYGLEFYIKKNSGKWTGWISYTLSRTENRIEGINQDQWYPVRYDKTHDLSLVTSLRVGRRWTLSGIWTYATGNAVTFPSGKYILDNNPVPYYTERNGYRMPAYHRLDFSATLDGKERKRYRSAWDFSIYNVYNRLNAYIITFRESETSPGETEAVKMSLFGIVPSVTYSFRF